MVLSRRSETPGVKVFLRGLRVLMTCVIMGRLQWVGEAGWGWRNEG